MLTPEQISARDGKVTASFVPYLCAGNKERIYQEFLRIVGDPSWQPEDLSMSWPVIHGTIVEGPALDYHERKTGRSLTRRGEVVVHPERPYLCSTLDAYRTYDDTNVEVKVVGSWRKIDDILSFYLPQPVIQRRCTGAKNSSFLIVHGGSEPVEYPVTWDDAYEARIFQLIDEFWQCCQTLTPPNDWGVLQAPVKPEKVYSFQGNNQFASEAVVWLETYKAAKRAAASEKALKAMVPPDASKVEGHNVVITRDRRGYLSLREAKS